MYSEKNSGVKIGHSMINFKAQSSKEIQSSNEKRGRTEEWMLWVKPESFALFRHSRTAFYFDHFVIHLIFEL